MLREGEHWAVHEGQLVLLLGFAGGAGGAGELYGARDVDYGDDSVSCVPCTSENTAVNRRIACIPTSRSSKPSWLTSNFS